MMGQTRIGAWGVLAVLGVLACSTSRAGGVPAATGGSGAATPTPTGGDGGAERRFSAHTFQPRAHEPHLPPVIAELPPPDALPRFVDGQNRCFARYEPVERRPPVYSAPGGYGSGYGSLGGSGRGVGGGGVATPSRSAAKSSAEGVADGNAYAPSGPPAAAPASPPKPASMPMEESRREKKASPARDDARKGESESLANSAPEPERRPSGNFGQAVYLSNDDTMSLSSAQRVLWAIDRFAPIPPEHVRPHELLNYFSFDTQPVPRDYDFSVLPSAEMGFTEAGTLTLALAVQGRPLNRESRRNVNLSYVIDRSGSMAAEGRMEYLKRGLLRSLRELKTGDVVHLTLFDDTACDLAQNFVVGRDSMPRLESLIQRIQPEGSTNLHDGLTRGYAAVDRTYQPGYTNRVVLITDAIANTGITDESMIATVAKHYDERKVRLSGVGVGSDFNDSLLDRLTERGKGAYVFLGSGAEVDAVFGSHFVSLIETIANDVHFRLHLPPSLAMKTFYGEEASTVKERVQSIHYFANTSQMFLSDLTARDGIFPAQDDIMLTIEYTDAESGRQKVEEFAWNLGRIAGRSENLKKAVMVSHFARELGALAARPAPSVYAERAGSWVDGEAAARCDVVKGELAQLGAGSGDPEVHRVESLWSKFCSRYSPPPAPVRPSEPRRWPDEKAPPRNNEFAPKERWPSAQ